MVTDGFLRPRAAHAMVYVVQILKVPLLVDAHRILLTRALLRFCGGNVRSHYEQGSKPQTSASLAVRLSAVHGPNTTLRMQHIQSIEASL